jgi:hypothetical protein
MYVLHVYLYKQQKPRTFAALFTVGATVRGAYANNVIAVLRLVLFSHVHE